MPEPSPTCCGIASTTRRCAPPASPNASRQRCANVSARSASGPSADSSSAGSASSTTAGRSTDTPSPPKRRSPSLGDREHAQVQARGRLDAHPAHQSSDHRAHVLHRLALARAAGLVHEHLQAAQLGADLLGVEHAHARGEDRRLEDRVARPVEAEELAAGAAVDHHRADPGTLRAVVDRLHPHLAPRAGVVQHRALDAGRRMRRRLRVAERGLAEQQHVVGQVHDGRPGRAQVAQRARSPEGLDDDPLAAPLDAHRAAVDAAVRVQRRHHRLDDH